jgi:hypothetical protein
MAKVNENLNQVCNSHVKEDSFLESCFKAWTEFFLDDNLCVTFDHFVCEQNIFGALVST